MHEVPFLSLTHQHNSIRTQLDDAVRRVLDSNLFLLGDELSEFERKYAAFSGARFCVGVSNGLDAIYLCLRALGIGPGDDVIVPSHTYIATWLAVTMTGARPVPVEPDLHTYTVDPALIAASITAKTRAIVPVHLFGQACEMDSIMRIAHDHNLLVVEDNAQAHGALFKGKVTGSFGHCNATSFYPTKNLGAMGDGGAVTTDDESLFQSVRKLRNYGSDKKFIHDVPGVNSRLSEIQAAILTVKLNHLSHWNQQRLVLANAYLERLQGVGDLVLPVAAPDRTHVYHLFVIRTQLRNELQHFLASSGIQTMVHYPVPPHLQRAYSDLIFQKGQFPTAEHIAETSLSLPLWPGLTVDTVDRICAEVKRFYRERV